MLQAPFQMLGMLIMMGQRAAASAERIYEILDEQPTIVDRPGAIDLVDCRGDVLRDGRLRVRRRQPPGLSDFDLHLRPGETVALVGRTGGGKSTVARLLDRFYDVTAEPSKVDGHDVRDLTLASLRANVGIVLDEPFLFSSRSGTTSPTADPTPTSPTSRRRPRGRGRRVHPRAARRATRPWSASAATRCRAASASGSPSPARCS
jgi:ABC-type multidrug transport system fused ATPase/permease subunit